MNGGTLTFPINDRLKSIVEHAAANDPGPFYGETIDRSLFLVKDQGVYLMSAGKPGLIDPDIGEPKQLVVYADGHNPDVDDFDDWWEEGRRVCGGDDFGEPLGLKFFQNAIARGATTLTITFAGDQMTMEAK